MIYDKIVKELGGNMSIFLHTFLLFFIYSVAGWVIECLFCKIYYHKLVDRGFLLGPYCPIYGVSALCMIKALERWQNDWLVLFVMAVLIASIVEYITSYIMELIFHTRWWDYSNNSFNVNGRICLLNSLLFGILGIILLKMVNPFVNHWLLGIPTNILNIISIILLIVFIIDFIISFNIIFKLQKSVVSLKKDRTLEVSTKVRDILNQKSIWFSRINFAFPNYKLIPKKIKKETKKLTKKKLKKKNKR